MELEYLGVISYEKTIQKCGFFLHINSALNELPSNKVILFGTGIESFIVRCILENKKFKIEYYLDSFPQKHEMILNERQIISPYGVFKNTNGHIVVAVSSKSINSVRIQLKLHGIEKYSIFFIEKFHDFGIEKEKTLRDLVIRSINRISVEGKSIQEVAPVFSNVSGEDVTKLGNLNYLLYSTIWSHHVYKWLYEGFKNLNYSRDVLEIGPGYGLLSLVISTLTDKIDLDWLCFSGQNHKNSMNSELSMVGKEFSNVNLNIIYGIIENPDFIIAKKYDAIIMTEVFEHFVANPLPTMKKISTMLKRNGKVYFTTPNWGNLYQYDRWEDIKEYKEFNSEEEYLSMYCGHTYQYSKAELFDIFRKCNFKIERYEISDGNNHNILLSNING